MRKHLTRPETIKGYEWLKDRIQILREATETTRALVRYRNGEDDNTLSSYLNCTIDQAKRLRNELFGDLVQIRPATVVDSATHDKMLEQAEYIGKLALLLAELLADLGQVERAHLARKIAQDISLADL